MKFLKYFFLSLTILTVSCESDNKNVSLIKMNDIASYPKTEIISELFNVNDSVFFPENIWIYDSVLLAQVSGNTNILRLYSLNNGEKLNEFINVGRGGNEYVSPHIFKNDSENMIINDKMHFDIINIPDALKSGRYKSSKIKVPGLNAINYLSEIKENYLVYNSFSSDDQLNFINLDNNEITEYNNYPKINGLDKIPNFIANTQVFSSVKNQNKDKIFMGYELYPILDILDKESMNVKRISFPIDYKYNNITIVDNLNAVIDNRYYCYTDTYITNNFLYLLYMGASEENLSMLNVFPEIHKFSFEGDLINRYILDLPISKIAITDEDTECYAIGIKPDFEIEIIKFQL